MNGKHVIPHAELTTNQPNPLCFATATCLVAEIQAGSLSSVEVMAAYLDQIERHNGDINAFTNLLDKEEAMSLAAQADEEITRGQPLKRLHGLPMAVKDLANAVPFPTTFGSPIFKDFLPESDDLYVERIKRAGALIIGKTNVPEFGLGSHTFNTVFGTTRNPFDLGRTAGGSSGGAAAALASGMVPLADGSDLGGSLRNPAAFNGICALRPSVGRVPIPMGGWLARNSVIGPMGRNVEDVALLLAVMAGHDERDPVSIREDGDQFAATLQHDFKGTRVAWGGDLGMLEVDAEIMQICQGSLATFEMLGCHVEESYPNLEKAMDVFQIQRAIGMLNLKNRLDVRSPDWRTQIKETAIWNIDKGLALTPAEIVRSDMHKAEIHRHMLDFFASHDYLLLPTTQVAPFPIEVEWVRQINGTEMSTYIDWMASCCVISITGLPAASIPCGFTHDGLPVGLQIVGKPLGDFQVLQLAYAFEQASHFARPVPRGR